MTAPNELAVKLLHDHKDEIARGVYKVVCKLQPHWAAVDADAFAKNGASLISAIETYLRGGDVEPLFAVAREMLRVRRLGGMEAADFHVLLHSYLPVIRKAFIARAPTLSQGLAAFDVAESVLLALVTRLVEVITKTTDEITAPDTSGGMHGRAFEPMSVGDQVPEFMRDIDDDDEPTNPSARGPRAGRPRS